MTRTFAIITTEANAIMAPIHNRMPVVLEPDAWPVWLGEAEGDVPGLLRPAGDDVLRTWLVGTEVNNARHNGPGLLKPMREEAPGGGPNPG